MKRFFLNSLAADAASVAAFLGMLLIGLANWFMTDSPLWFDVLCVVVVALSVLVRYDGKQFALSNDTEETKTYEYLMKKALVAGNRSQGFAI